MHELLGIILGNPASWHGLNTSRASQNKVSGGVLGDTGSYTRVCYQQTNVQHSLPGTAEHQGRGLGRNEPSHPAHGSMCILAQSIRKPSYSYSTEITDPKVKMGAGRTLSRKVQWNTGSSLEAVRAPAVVLRNAIAEFLPVPIVPESQSDQLLWAWMECVELSALHSELILTRGL